MPICVNCGKSYLRGSKPCAQCESKILKQASLKKQEIIPEISEEIRFKEKILSIKAKVDIINNADFKMLENINQKNLIKFCNVIKANLGKNIEISKVIAHKEDGVILKGRTGFLIKGNIIGEELSHLIYELIKVLYNRANG